LILVPKILGWDEPSPTFDVALHLGTLVALVLYFRNEWLGLATSGIRWLGGNRTDPKGRLAIYIVLATIPAALAGAFFEKQIESFFRGPLTISIALVALALVLVWAEKVGRQSTDLDHITLPDSLTVGFAQALALIPGVSRSGVTITAGLFRGLTATESHAFLAGIIVSGIVGYLAIAMMIRYLSTHSMYVFIYYRIALGIGVFLAFLGGFR
jgi:undecaprenyl-diphosphatase